MIHFGVDTKYKTFANEVPRISCKHHFGEILKNKNWALAFPITKYPKCFDLSDQNATFGGGDFGRAGFQTIALRIMKCGETGNPLISKYLKKNNTAKCRSNSSIKKWFSGKRIAILFK